MEEKHAANDGQKRKYERSLHFAVAKICEAEGKQNNFIGNLLSGSYDVFFCFFWTLSNLLDALWRFDLD